MGGGVEVGGGGKLPALRGRWLSTREAEERLVGPFWDGWGGGWGREAANKLPRLWGA